MKKYSGLAAIPSGMASPALTAGCLALEGGAFRGLYTEGALDAMMQNDLNLQCTIGVSAGALSGVDYVSGQIGRAARVNLGFRHDSAYIGLKALFKCKSPLRIDFLFDEFESIEPLAADRFYDESRRFVVVTTHCLTGKTTYFERTRDPEFIAAVKASASMPFGTPMVDVGGEPHLDGGCSCKIPYQWAIDQQFEKIIVIKTRERGYRKKITGRRLGAFFYRHYPEFGRVLDRSPEDYNRQCDELDQLERSGRVFVLAPSQPVTVRRIESDMEKLGDLYWLGYHDALDHLEAMKEYLGVTP